MQALNDKQNGIILDAQKDNYGLYFRCSLIDYFNFFSCFDAVRLSNLYIFW